MMFLLVPLLLLLLIFLLLFLVSFFVHNGSHPPCSSLKFTRPIRYSDGAACEPRLT